MGELPTPLPNLPTSPANSEKTLTALHQAALLVASETSLDKVLQQIVDAARQLAHARYGALGVANANGYFARFIHSGMPPTVVKQIGELPHGEGLLGAVIREREVIRVRQISHDNRSVGLPKNHPPMNSFLGVPLLVDGESVGNLYLTEKLDDGVFSADDQRLVEMLAAHAAVAIAKARLYEQIENLAVAEERTRIGMDLHDGVIQSIYAVGLTLESARLTIDEDSAEAKALITSSVAQLNRTIADIRNFIMDLRPRHFDGNLQQGIAQLVREFQANTLVPVALHFAARGERLPSGGGRTLFLTTQEALANVARHADASQVEVSVTESADSTQSGQTATITLTIRDNGCGFDPSTITHRSGHGLTNMHTRTENLRGSFSITSAPDDGTTLQLTLPLTDN